MARKKQSDISEDNAGEFAGKPSRSAKKRESAALQKLGEELAKLPPSSRVDLDLPEELEEALRLHDKITDREGARRQRQFIGRLMRSLDARAIESALALRRNARASDTALFHRAEKLRDKILKLPDENLQVFLRELLPPRQDNGETLQNLFDVAVKARREKSLGISVRKTGPRAARQLFRMLMEIINQ